MKRGRQQETTKMGEITRKKQLTKKEEGEHSTQHFQRICNHHNLINQSIQKYKKNLNNKIYFINLDEKKKQILWKEGKVSLLEEKEGKKEYNQYNKSIFIRKGRMKEDWIRVTPSSIGMDSLTDQRIKLICIYNMKWTKEEIVTIRNPNEWTSKITIIQFQSLMISWI